MASRSHSESIVSAKQEQVLTLTLTPTFKLVFLSVLAITVLSMIVGCCLVVASVESEPAKALMTTCLSTFKLGFGAIIGLLGGKAI